MHSAPDLADVTLVKPQDWTLLLQGNNLTSQGVPSVDEARTLLWHLLILGTAKWLPVSMGATTHLYRKPCIKRMCYNIGTQIKTVYFTHVLRNKICNHKKHSFSQNESWHFNSCRCVVSLVLQARLLQLASRVLLVVTAQKGMQVRHLSSS